MRAPAVTSSSEPAVSRWPLRYARRVPEPKLQDVPRLVSQHGNDIEALYGLLQRVDEKVDAVDAKVETLDVKVNAVDAKVVALDERLTGLAESVDARFEAVDARFDAVDARFDATDATLAEIVALLRDR